MKVLLSPSFKGEIEIAKGVNVEVEGVKVKVKGPLGVIERSFEKQKVKIYVQNGKVVVENYVRGRRGKATVNAVLTHIKNMMDGVLKGFKYKLKIIYSHFPISVKVEGDHVVIENFRGEKRRRLAKILEGVRVEVKGDEVIVTGIDKEKVGQTAANIEMATKSRGYDPRVFQDGIYVFHKE